MNYENISLTYGIIYKLSDELDDEQIYNNIFPNGKLIVYPILFLYNIYFFYFNDYNSDVFILTFLLELWYIVILFLRYSYYGYVGQKMEICMTYAHADTCKSIHIFSWNK